MAHLRANTVPALLEARVQASPQGVACAVREASAWRTFTWAEVRARVDAARGQLARLGVGEGHTVAIMAPNHLHWDVVHWAALELGARVVGLDAIDRPDNVSAMLQLTSPTVIAVGDEAAVARLGVLPAGAKLVSLGPSRARSGILEPLATEPTPPLASPARVLPGTAATTIFTSGTTGTPKGITYTHQQVCLAVDTILEVLPELQAGERQPSWLPQAHLFQRIINLCALAVGGVTYYVEKPLDLPQLLPDIAPHVLIGVPRFFEKVWQGVRQKVDQQPPPARALATWALRVGQQHAAAQRAGHTPSLALRLRHALADRLVLSSIRRALGGRLRFMVSGAAPLAPWLLDAFHGVGLLVLEAYGLSENVVPVAFNSPRAFRFGSVGRPLTPNTVKLSEAGEVLVKGAGVFGGYLQGGDAPLDADGFLHTGDLGQLDADGFLRLVGRASEVFKTSTGRKVPARAVEAALLQADWVELAVLVATGRAVPVALLFVSLARLGGTDARGTLEHQLPRLRDDVRAVTSALPDYQRPGGVVLLTRPPSIDTGELTANLKVRRAQVESRYANALAELTARLETRDASPAWLADLSALVATV